MKIEALLNVLKGIVNLPLTDSQKITLIKEFISGVEFRIEQDE